MSKLLELKIRNYKKIIHDHNRANKNYYHEILVLVQQCEGRYKSVTKAPDDSPEWLYQNKNHAYQVGHSGFS